MARTKSPSKSPSRKSPRRASYKEVSSTTQETHQPPLLLYGNDPDLQQYYLERHHTAFIAAAFADKNAAVEDGTTKKDNRKTKQRADLMRIANVVTYWNKMAELESAGTITDTERKEFKDFKKKKENKPGAKWRTQFHVEEVPLPDKSLLTVVRRIELCKQDKTMKPGRIVVCQEDAFDLINEHHRAGTHLGQEATYNNANIKYYNLTQEMVIHFCRTCPTCLEDNPIVPPTVGAAKPILSYAWRDRYQVDLIDMRKFARKNVYGITQRWIMTVKDHFTGFTAVFSLPYKEAKYVAFELEKYFGLVGYPIIFHTDNGNEFVARQIIEMLAEINPAIITVTGRPRTPRDQGSVERVNATVKRAVASVCAERRREGKDDNWTMLLGLVTSSLNTHRSRLANSVEAYPTVFGAPYHIPIKTSLADARKCQTITELQPLLIDDGHISRLVQEHYNTNDCSYSAQEEHALRNECKNYWTSDVAGITDDADFMSKLYYCLLNVRYSSHRI